MIPLWNYNDFSPGHCPNNLKLDSACVLQTIAENHRPCSSRTQLHNVLLRDYIIHAVLYR